MLQTVMLVTRDPLLAVPAEHRAAPSTAFDQTLACSATSACTAPLLPVPGSAGDARDCPRSPTRYRCPSVAWYPHGRPRHVRLSRDRRSCTVRATPLALPFCGTGAYARSRARAVQLRARELDARGPRQILLVARHGGRPWSCRCGSSPAASAASAVAPIRAGQCLDIRLVNAPRSICRCRRKHRSVGRRCPARPRMLQHR